MRLQKLQLQTNHSGTYRENNLSLTGRGRSSCLCCLSLRLLDTRGLKQWQKQNNDGLYVCPGTAVARPCLEVSNRTVFTAHAFLTVLLLNAAVLQSYNEVYKVNKAFYSNQPADGEPSWDVFCLICGGPSCNPAKIAKTIYPQHKQVSVISDLPHLSELASNFGWLEECVGIPEDNMPVALGLYDGQGDFELSGNRLFGPYPSYAQAERTPNKTYGLNCHRKCYHLLHDELGYKLRYQDIWPKLAAANDDSECLDSTYGGMAEYHEHLFEYSYLAEDKNGWMMLDPTENKQNAQRILTVWKDVPEARRPALMTAVFCSFKRAVQLAKDEPATKQTAQPVTREHTDTSQLWKSMARVMPAVLRSIIERAFFHPDYLGYACHE